MRCRQPNGNGAAHGDLMALQTTVKMAIGTVEVVPCSLFHRYFARQLEANPGLPPGPASRWFWSVAASTLPTSKTSWSCCSTWSRTTAGGNRNRRR